LIFSLIIGSVLCLPAVCSFTPFSFLFFSCDVVLRALHSFPTRRSSDLHILVNPSVWQFQLRYFQMSELLEIPLSLVDIHLIISRSEEHTSELQSRFDLVCRLLLEKKKIIESIIGN